MSRRPPELVLVRHGETEWTRSGQHTGNTDIPLTDQGCRQAMLIGDRLRGRSFALVLTSPLQRAAETARLAGYDAAACDDLREWDYGLYEGRTTSDIRAEHPGWTLWREGVPRGETAEQVAGRVDRVIDRARSVDGDTALFAHGHVLRVLTARWLRLEPEDGRLFALDPATLSILGHERETPVIRLWNTSVSADAANSGAYAAASSRRSTPAS